jgi:hypothetical protein
MIGAIPAARDGHDARVCGLGEPDRHASNGAGGGADEHAAARPDVADVVDPYVGRHARGAQDAKPLQRAAEGRVGATTIPTLLAGTDSPAATCVTSDEPRSIRSW